MTLKGLLATPRAPSWLSISKQDELYWPGQIAPVGHSRRCGDIVRAAATCLVELPIKRPMPKASFFFAAVRYGSFFLLAGMDANFLTCFSTL